MIPFRLYVVWYLDSCGVGSVGMVLAIIAGGEFVSSVRTLHAHVTRLAPLLTTPSPPPLPHGQAPPTPPRQATPPLTPRPAPATTAIQPSVGVRTFGR